METAVLVAVIGVGGSIVTVAGALVGTVIGSRLNQANNLKTAHDLIAIERHKYTQDRLWDVRKEAYSRIIAGLHSLKKLSEIVYEGFFDGELGPEEYFHSGAYNKHTRELWAQYQITKAEFENNRLLLSDEFVAGFEAIEAKLEAVDEDDIPPSIYSDTYDIFKDAIEPMLLIAKAEIAPRLPAVT